MSLLIKSRSKQADEYIAKMLKKETPYLKEIAGTKLRIDRDVYPTGKIGILFKQALDSLSIEFTKSIQVLDYGTGTGFLAICAACKGAEVVALDINPGAIKCAKHNAQLNQVYNKISFRVSDNLGAINEHEKFDFILAGLPWENATPKTLLEMAFYDENFSMRKALANNYDKLLKDNGCILMSSSKRIEENAHMSKFFPNLVQKKIAEGLINGEPHYIIGFFK